MACVECKCRIPLCRHHVDPEQHGCEFDYKAHARDILARQNPKVVSTTVVR